MMGATGGADEATTGGAEATAAPTNAIVESVARAEGWEPAEVPASLYECIDPDALEAFVATMDDGQVTFPYLGYEVTVDADGSVSLSE
jgi:hypothetical protein